MKIYTVYVKKNSQPTMVAVGELPDGEKLADDEVAFQIEEPNLDREPTEEEIETAEFVPENFVIWMFVPIINIFWAMQRKCWLLLTLIILTYYVLFFTGADNNFFESELAVGGVVFSKFYILLRLIILIFLASNANDFWRKSLEKRGYQMVDIVSASDEIEAQRRFFDRRIGIGLSPKEEALPELSLSDLKGKKT